MKRKQLTTRILIALVLGAIVGGLLYPMSNTPFIRDYIIGFLFKLVGSTFINAIKMMVVPLVFVSLTVGAAAKEAGVTLSGFIRLEVGEGIEKKESNFAEEVMQQVSGG